MIVKRAARWLKLATGCRSLGIGGVTISPSYAANDTEIYIVRFARKEPRRCN